MDGAFDKYPPSNERFKISDDPISQEREKALIELQGRLKELFPHVPIALTLFGSLSKGRVLTPENAKHSDVDFCVYFDADSLKKQHEALLKSNELYAHRYKLAGASSIRAMKMALEVEIVRNCPEVLIGVEKQTFVEPIQRVGKYSISECLVKLSEYDFSSMSVSRLLNSVAVQQMARFFHRDIELGLQRYRHHFFEAMDKLPEHERESLWSIVSRCMRTIERSNIIPEKAEWQFPEKYAAAKEFYQLPQ